jgi:thioredoxin 1
MKPLRGLESRGWLEHLKTEHRRGSAPGLTDLRNKEKANMSENIQAVSDASFDKDVIEASKTQPVLVDFWADWCRPCHMLSPTVEEIAKDHVGKLKVVKLNVDENVNAAGKFNIRGIPTLLIFKGGQVADQLVGAVPKEQIEKVVQRHIS